MQERSPPRCERRRHLCRAAHSSSGCPDPAARQPSAARGARRVDARLLLGPPVGADRRIAARAGARVAPRARHLLPAGSPPHGTAVVVRAPRRHCRRDPTVPHDLEGQRHAGAGTAAARAAGGPAPDESLDPPGRPGGTTADRRLPLRRLRHPRWDRLADTHARRRAAAPAARATQRDGRSTRRRRTHAHRPRTIR